MSEFAEALRAYHDGSWSTEQLLSEVDREVGEKRTDAVTLLAILYEENSRTELPATVHGALERKILQWLHQYSVMRTRAPNDAGQRASGERDGDATVVFDTPGANEDSSEDPEEAPKSRARHASIGDVLHGRFKLVERIGEGGMSCVYKAIDMRKVEARSPEPYMAVKLLTVPVADYSRALVLLQREAQKLQSLTHPNIVRVSDCDRDGKTVFMTMEYLSGESLQRKFQPAGFTGLPASEATRIVECIAGALAAAHRNGIVHGDLKPGNVIITDRSEVKVIDFGIARVMQGEDDAAEVNAFTPPYASPEMLRREEPDPRDDVYALACIANEIFTGRHPFDWKTAIEARDAALFPTRWRGISRRQFKAVTRGLAFDREQRTRNVEQFLDEFRGTSVGKRNHLIGIAAVLLIAVLSGVYLMNRTRPVEVPATPVQSNVVAKLSQGDIFRDCPTCPLMRVLPAGQLLQGSTAADVDSTAFERPQHAVIIPHVYGMATYEVTVAEFREFVDATGHDANGCEIYDGDWHQRADRSWRAPGYAGTGTYPVSCVSWQDASAYVAWLSTKTNQRYRLPSASEWEYAARDRSEAARPWGAQNESACESANVADETAAQRFPGWAVLDCSDGYVYAAPVGSFAPSSWGLYDMFGNVFEWVEDCWQGDYINAPTDGTARVDGDCSQREMRGASWFTTPSYVRASHRNRFEASHRSSSVGFRVVRDISE